MKRIKVFTWHIFRSLKRDVVAEDQKFMDCKTGTVNKAKRVDGAKVILETDDGRNRILTVAGSIFRNRGLRFAIRNKKRQGHF